MVKKKKRTEEETRRFKDTLKANAAKVEDSDNDGTLEDKKYLIKYIIDCKKEAERATKGLRDKQRELWLLYQNKENWDKKKKWQSKVFIPKIFMAVERATSLVKRAILQTSKLFTMEQMDEKTAPLNSQLRELRMAESVDEEAIDTVQKKLDLLKEQLTEDERRFKKELKHSNFVSGYGEMTKSSFLLGLGDLKRLWDDNKKKLRYENIDVLNLYISPDYMPFEDENPDYLIEYKEMKLAYLRKMAEATNKEAGSEVFDMEEVENIKSDFQKAEKQEEQRIESIQQSLQEGGYSGVLGKGSL